MEAWKRPGPPKGAIVGGFLLFVRKIAILFSNDRSQGKEIDASLLSIKETLEALKKVDQSTNSHFCEHFSAVWHTLLEEIERAGNLKAEKLISEMGHYPEGEPHQLGHYLTHYAGESWLPVPFQEILKKLHNDPERLAEWIQLIQE